MSRNSIHDFGRKFELLRAKIERAPVLKENKQLLVEFERYCAAEGLSIARRWKLLEYMYVFSTRYFHGPYRTATTDQIWTAVLEIESSDLAPWTKHDFKVAIRKFFKYVEWGNEALRRKGYPESVNGISIKVKKRDQVRVQAADILSEEEVDRLISSAQDTQERAYISLMYELGARIGEIGPMRIRNVSRDSQSYLCDVNGKTGPRSVRVIRSAGSLTAWLNVHPARNQPEATLWGSMVQGNWQPASYSLLRGKVSRLQKRAGIKKRVHPHLFRHSRITHVLADGHLNEAQAKVYFGLVQDSERLATYSHLLSKDANDAVLRMYGVSPKKRVTRHPAQCGMCSASNDNDANHCAQCGYALSGEAAEDSAQRVSAAGDRLLPFLRRPEIEKAFRGMIRAEIESALGRALLQQPARRMPPTRE